jgi:predicted ATPase/class 3 adenylate cyclase
MRRDATEREEIEQAIATLETLRDTLGDTAVDTSIAALREKLDTLRSESFARQRKQVTVLFCDLVGFTPMAEKMDPEYVREVLDLYFEPWREAVVRHGGRVEKFIGDAVMAVFGIPTASENDPANAVRAALEVRDGLDKVNAAIEGRYGVRVAMRVGINTGTVLVGELGGEVDLSVIGDTVNVASRLEGRAPRNGILISHDTYRHVRGLFDVEVQEPVRVKGRAEPVQAYVVQRRRPRAFHRGMREVEGVETRMVGRQAELERLQEAYHRVVTGGGLQAVTVVGEAGVGKSRLLYELENWVDLLPARIHLFKGRASPERQGMPYGLIRDLLSFRFEIQDSDGAGVVREKLEAGMAEALGPGAGSDAKAHFIGRLLGFDFGDSPDVGEALDDARQVRDRALMYLSEYFGGMAARQPAVLLLEDVHWADGSSLDVLDSLVMAMAGQPLLMVCLARPELLRRRPGWGEGQAFHEQLRLQRLSVQDCGELVGEILQRVEEVPGALRELVVSKAEGNPFYVEELIKMLIEDRVIETGDERWRVEAKRLGEVPVPPTLTGVLQARLDRLPSEERTVIQQASVVGPRFWDRAVVRIGEAADEGVAASGVVDALTALGGREMVYRLDASTFAGTREYLFKHALLREVAYESVLRRIRRRYHGLVAEWLMERSGERSGEYTGLIAEHLEAAERKEEAAIYLRRAGQRAAGQYANAEAVTYFSRALNLIPQEDDPGNRSQRYELLLARERVHDLLAAREAQAEDLAALDELAESLADNGQQSVRRRAEVALRLANYADAVGDYPAAIEAAQKAIDLAQGIHEVSLEAKGYRRWGRALWRQGDFALAQRRLEQALELARRALLRPVEAESLHELGAVVSHQGDFAGARGYLEQSRRLCRKIRDRRGEGRALTILGSILARQGDYAGARSHLEQSLRIRREIGDRWGEAGALNNLGVVSRRQGDYVGARAYYERSLQAKREIGDQRGVGVSLVNLGIVGQDLGDYAQARGYCEQALQIFRELGDRSGETVVLAHLGTIDQGLGQYLAARTNLERALHIHGEIGDREGMYTCLNALSRNSLELGDLQTAREHAERALTMVRDVGDPSAEATALRYLGDALLALGHHAEAEEAFQQSVDLRLELGEHHRAVSPLAALARVSLARGNVTQALARAEQILHSLEAEDSTDTGVTAGIYLTCYQVLRASQDHRADDLLTAAHNLLQQQAARITDDELRHSYLQNVAVHSEILELWQAHQSGGDSS